MIKGWGVKTPNLPPPESSPMYAAIKWGSKVGVPEIGAAHKGQKSGRAAARPAQ